MAVIDRFDALRNDRAFVQVVVDVMRRGADQFHAFVVGLMVGLCAFETRQQRVVDVDRPAIETTAQIGRQHLHVARKHHQFGAGLLNHPPHLTLLRLLVVGVEGEVVIRHVVPARQRLQVRVVGDHRHHVHRQLTDTLAIEQVIQAVIGLGDHDHHFWPIVRLGQFEHHAEGLTARGQAQTERLLIEALRLAELDANEEPARQPVIEGVVFGDVAVLLVQIAGHRVHRA